VLDLTLDQLVTIDAEPPPPPAAAADPNDADLLLALLLAYGSLGVEQLLDALGWAHHRLAAAVASAEAVATPTPLRLVVTDQRIACILRPGALPAEARTPGRRQRTNPRTADRPRDRPGAVPDPQRDPRPVPR
jgi:hypothetical protein